MATLPGSSIVERGENHPESQLPIISDGTAGGSSCRDQSQSTDVLGPRLLLYENRPEPKHKIRRVARSNCSLSQTSCQDQLQLEPKHKIFLSHSSAQKSFVKQLCKDIERFDRYPFFDVLRTSLSIGCHFPKAIFKAIRECQVAVVVLSEDFFSRTRWPMLELSALVTRKVHDPDLVIMPVFLGLTRQQCRAEENHGRWFALWEEWAKKHPRIRLDEWMAVFEVFGYTNSVSVNDEDEVKCREDVVDAVCKEVRPETRRDDSHVQGRSRMCKTIDDRIGGLELSNCYKVRVLGLYGMGGIGKSTACMTLCNYYFEEFHGQVCLVEFGVMDELHMLQEILKRLTDTSHEQIARLNKEECRDRMKNIKNQKVLLAVDNVFESYEIVEQATFILRAGFASNSIVIVTARSLEELINLEIRESDCMEMPELTMDDAISLFVQKVSCDKSTNGELIRECVDRCYFSKGDGLNYHYHPLALRVLGGQLGSDSSKWRQKLVEESDLFNQYRARFDKHPIFSILRRSFDILNDEDKDLFMDCALFATHYSDPLGTDGDIYPWLSMIHGKQIETRLNGLKRKSVIQSWEDDIGIHDLWREFCVMEMKDGELESRRWIYEDLNSSSDPCIEESNMHCGVWRGARRISFISSDESFCNVHLSLGHCSNLIALRLEDVDLEGNALDLNGVLKLKSLTIKTVTRWNLCGLGSLKQLRLLEWSRAMPSSMAFIQEIGKLSNLRILNLSTFDVDVEMQFPDLSGLSLLQRVAFCGFNGGGPLSFNSGMTNLQQLSLQCCFYLQKCDGICDLVELEELEISSCVHLKELPDFQVFRNLKKLVIGGCPSIQTLLGLGSIATLVKLQARDLVELPNLSKLTNLQVLDLWMGSLNTVVMGFSELINLQECSIPIIGIGEFSDLQKLTKLRCMTVHGWSLGASSSVDSLVNLENLSVWHSTGVDSLGGLSKVMRLCYLYLWYCDFKDVACLKDLIGLRHIRLSNCNLLEIFPDMHKATRLERVHIMDCENLQVWEGLNRERALSSRPYEVNFQSGGELSSLQSLAFNNSAISELPDLSTCPKLKMLCVESCPNLLRLTSSLPLTSLEHFHIKHCKSLTTIPNLSGCKHLERVLVQNSGVTLSENEIKYLKVMCPTIVIDLS